MNTTMLNVMSDDQLWLLSRKGDREAFGRIVERYQTLICSLAYSACGDLARSEDLAQESFITAWQKLGELREPTKLRGWLCGIVRNLAANTKRREQRRGGAVASLDSVAEQVGPDADPAGQAVTQEEASLLWRSLAGLSDAYREPMVLFYRQGRSVAEVAQALDLSEDAVKQRLSRGRSMLRDELVDVVEGLLARTRPSTAFTVAVLVALPALAPSTAVAAAATSAAASGKGAVATKGLLASMSFVKVLVGPAIGVFIGLLSAKAAASTARTQQERDCILRHARWMVIFCFAMSAVLVLVLSQAGKGFLESPVWIVMGVLAWVTALVTTIMWSSFRMHRQVLRIRAATGTLDEAYGAALAERGLKLCGPLVYESNLRFLGLPLVAVGCGGSDAGSFRTRKAIGWIAIGDVAISPLLAFGGFAFAPFAVGGATAGIFSFSLWGAALGVLAFGSVAVGWWAYGLAALGWQAAAGVAAAANEYAVGVIAHAADANTAVAKQWFAAQWFSAPVDLFLHNAHWAILLVVLLSVGRVLFRSWQLRRRTR
jgi:RNA polymerase sigma factor (sigma-70 family)